jgi:nitrilase
MTRGSPNAKPTVRRQRAPLNKGSSHEHRVAVVQHPPVLLDLKKTTDRAIELMAECAREGAVLATFPEAFLPGYPEWVWRLRPGADFTLSSEIHRRLIENAVDVEAGGLERVQRAARTHNLTVVLGINERDGAYSRSTLYNTVVVIGPDGAILNRHRKLMPTNPERMVWGQGDGSGLNVVDTPAGRVGALICWENYMPLARFAIYAQGPDLYIAPTWDEGETWNGTMRHIASEARCWVVGNGTSLQARDVPSEFPGRAELFPDDDEWINPGDSVIVSPLGEMVAGPLHAEHGILYAECDPAVAAAARRTLDVAGHYGRPDIFHLEVNREHRTPITFALRD